MILIYKRSEKLMELESFTKMKNFNKNFLRKRKGITLIALVITIIVLLILARNFDIDVIRR